MGLQVRAEVLCRAERLFLDDVWLLLPHDAYVCHITADIFIIRKCACTFSKRYTCPSCFACLRQTAVARPFSSSAPALAATSRAPPFRIVLQTPPDDIDMAFVFCSTRTCGLGRVM